MKPHYYVKFISNNEMHYGVVNSLSNRAQELAKEGKVLIEHAVLPQCHEIKEQFVSNVDIQSNGEYEQYIKRLFGQAQNLSDSLQGIQIGKLVRFSDLSYYVVTKILKNDVVLEWRGFSVERHKNEVLGYEGKMSKEQFAKKIAFESTLMNLFGKSDSAQLKSDL